MTEKRPDRRRERTFQMLSKALLELLKERDYSNITIQDVVDKADVSRATFYLHFKDKDELLFKSMERIYDELSSNYPLLNRNAFANQTYTHSVEDAHDFHHVAANADFYRAMLSAHGSPQFIGMVRAYLEKVLRDQILKPLAPTDGEPEVPLDFMAAYMAGAEIGVINWWLDNNMPVSPGEISGMLNQMCLFGMQWALRLPIDSNDTPT